jgi:hypothetical protein
MSVRLLQIDSRRSDPLTDHTENPQKKPKMLLFLFLVSISNSNLRFQTGRRTTAYAGLML